MKSLLATVFLALIATGVNALTYDVNRTINGADGVGTVIGFITTNGKLGELSQGDIDDWSLTLTAPNLDVPAGQTSDTITRSDGLTNLVGGAVSATPTELRFNFDLKDSQGEPVNSYLYLTGKTTNNYWCLETLLCIDDEISFTEVMGRNADGTVVALAEQRTGVVVFATASPIPVPAAVWLFGSGLIGLFGLARIRR